MADYDVIIIGSGPGGYVCAIKCAQLGLKTACVEGSGTLGGTCLNVGCIPSKALLYASHQYHEATKNFSKMGLVADTPTINLKQMMNYKDEIINQNIKGIEYLFKKNKVDLIKGWASITSENQILVNEKVYKTKKIVIASGSKASSLPNIQVDEKIVVTSTGALTPKNIPDKLIIIGAGVIGLELGSVYSRLGTHVRVIEFLDHVVPSLDSELQKHFKRILGKQGIKFEMGAAVSSTKIIKNKCLVSYTKRKDNSEHTDEADLVLIATGRVPRIAELKLMDLGLNVLESGRISVDHNWETNLKGVYAIGDCVEGPMLAHKAEDEGIAVAELIAGQKGHVNYNIIPSVIYTHPEVASVGKSEDELKEEGFDYKVGKFSFMGNGRAKTVFCSEGFVKILADSKTDKILGAHIIGPMAGDLIHEICVAMEFGASSEDLARTCHAHPTYSEAVKEAALACGLGAIHS
ncbi:MAG: dihydrolipoyl dehydrogenase [Paracoccaceae bacterium]|tara:strand:+ start:3965 stop:5353 length:1389 start_codon:yes stop_codon:yes gene_type:complete